MQINLIVAGVPQLGHPGLYGIGSNGGIPWSLPADLKHFKKLTAGQVLIMGRKTWESLPIKPLPGRKSIVISTTLHVGHPDVLVVGSMKDAVLVARVFTNEVWIIGGSRVYRDVVQHANPDDEVWIFMTCITPHGQHAGAGAFDTYFQMPDGATLIRQGSVESHGDLDYQFQLYSVAVSDPPPIHVELEGPVPRHEEYQYLELVNDIIRTSTIRLDRTGVGTRSKFGASMRFSLRDGSFPLFTTKRVFWRGIVEELLWFISGSTNARDLHDKGVHIWDANASRDFLDKRGLTDREEWDLGPVYGFQWRHFGAKYTGMHTDSSTIGGIDQLLGCIEQLKTNPNDRRIIMTAWNPVDLPLAALPPCHVLTQFLVSNGELTCIMYQRSADMGLGVPYNVASYALLTCMIAQVCDLKPGEFVHMLGDAHVYLNHIQPLTEQIARTPRPFPKVKLTTEIKDITAFKLKDIELVGYDPHPAVKMEMAV